MGHLIHEILMGFITFGGVAVLFASFVGLAIWIVRELARDK